MHTIYVLFRGHEVERVSPYLDPEESLSYFRRMSDTGEVLACRVTEAVAAEVRAAVGKPVAKGGYSAATMLRLYSYSMQKCADVT